ncbi:MAG: hypothetical protein E7603_06800 [Ruminococcaceae bacterium]|nr:hypothetical protein [Oscillospiraceae bacterium]
MKFHQLLCNGKEYPAAFGTDIRLQWNYIGEGKRNEKQNAFSVTVWDENGNTVFESGTIESSETEYRLSEKNGLKHASTYIWQVKTFTDAGVITSKKQIFETVINDLEKSPWIGCGLKKEDCPSAPIFTKIFLRDDIMCAKLHISALGLFSCKLNGVCCDHGHLMPPYTTYDRQVYFETLDLTNALKDGENILTIQLGNGYNEDYSRWGDRYFTPKGFRAALILKKTDGSTERIDTDESWFWQNSSITANGLYLGEECDSRLSFQTKYPAAIEPENAPKGKLLPNEMPSLAIIEEFSPVSEWETDGGTMYDFGQNMQGFCRISVTAPEGCVISLQHSELITPDGKPDLFTNRRARAKDIYICAGNGLESYQPTFTYHGFRYVFVEHTMPLSHFEIKALFLSADVGEKSFFQCSEPIINRIHALSTNSIRSNFVSIPTDCPMRDERTPCQMDSQMYEDAAMYNFNMYAYYKKWLSDITSGRGDCIEGNMDWHGDALMLTYRMYLFYGETAMAKKLYPLFKNTIEKWFADSENGIWKDGYGDWCLPNNNTWESYFGCKAAVNTSLFYAYTGIMAEFAELFGFPEDKKRFLAIGETIRTNYVAKYMHEDGSLGEGRQPEMLLPLFYGILTGENAEKAKNALLNKIKKDRFFDTGGFGLRTVLPVLADAKALNLFLETVRFNHYPGFGYWVAMGATTLWEQWASKGTMHSHNHAMHSGIEAALFQTLCGITPTSPMFRTFRIAPKIPHDLHSVQCKLKTYSGEIEMSLEKFSDSLVLSCVIPPNTQAEIFFPDFDSFNECILFDGERRIEKFKNQILGSGKYTFRLIPEKYVLFQPYQK